MRCEYVLYTHYSPPEPYPDRKPGPEPDQQEKDRLLRAYLDRELKPYLADLEALLGDEGCPGMAVLFYDPGWLELLNVLGTSTSARALHEALARAETLSDWAKKNVSTHRVRVLTALDLDAVVRSLRSGSPERARRLALYLSGESVQMRYDTPKFVEAIVRLRQVGSGIPVLRIDWDALLNRESLGPGRQGCLREALPRAVAAGRERFGDPRITSFVFSGGYRGADGHGYDHYATRFATRAAPAVPIDLRLMRGGPSPEEYIARAFDPELAERFFGTVAELGAHPEDAVISGALLCLSDTAVLDLPPFCNFDTQVSWIDDHLRYELHRALGQLAPSDIGHTVAPGYPARVPDCVVHKQRPQQSSDLFAYALASYLPALFRGCVMDSWIRDAASSRNDPPSPGPFPVALRDALRDGEFTDERRAALREALEERAAVRISHIRAFWDGLTTADGGCDSIASAWASGRVAEYPLEAVRPHGGEPWVGWGLYEPGSDRIQPAIQAELRALMTYVEGYVDWALEWSSVARSIRAWPRGELATDLEWRRPDEQGGQPK